MNAHLYRFFIIFILVFSMTPVSAQSGGTPSEDLAQIQNRFNAWITNFRARAQASGVSPALYDNAFASVSFNPLVIERDRFQPEFQKQIWDYMDTAVSPERRRGGRAALSNHKRSLAAIEKQYGVDAQILIAIWGLESAYGTRMGDFNIVEALASLAFDGRRKKFAESQLIEALKIIQRGDIAAAKMTGSWAGAMGHTQFIPTSYQAYAVDFTKDGRRDVWDPKDPRDALASTANYLREFGWKLGHPWGVEVALPQDFDYRLADLRRREDPNFWAQRGVRNINGTPLHDFGPAAIFLPAGAGGPAFAVYSNFFTLKRYNNANSYALAVGHLGDRVMGGSEISMAWPRGEEALTFSQKKSLQRLLTRRGFDTEGTDGIIGPNTIAAIRAYQKSKGLAPDGFASKSLLRALRRGN